MSRKKTRQQEARGGQGPIPAKGKRDKQRSRPGQQDRPVFEPNAAGIDIGAREIYVAVPADRDEHPVRRCETFTGDLHQMAEWLVCCGVTQQPWSPPECIGFRCTTRWSNTGSSRVW